MRIDWRYQVGRALHAHACMLSLGVCAHVCLCILKCLSKSMKGAVTAHVHIYVYICMYPYAIYPRMCGVCMYVCMCICVCINVYRLTESGPYKEPHTAGKCLYACMHIQVCICVCIQVCVIYARMRETEFSQTLSCTIISVNIVTSKLARTNNLYK